MCKTLFQVRYAAVNKKKISVLLLLKQKETQIHFLKKSGKDKLYEEK